MIVVDQDGLDIGHLEAHLLDILLHRFGGVRRAGAHHDVALGRRQQEHFSVGVADEIQIADDLEGLVGRGALGRLFADFVRRIDQRLAELGVLGGEGRGGRLRKGRRADDDGREADCQQTCPKFPLHGECSLRISANQYPRHYIKARSRTQGQRQDNDRITTRTRSHARDPPLDADRRGHHTVLSSLPAPQQRWGQSIIDAYTGTEYTSDESERTI